MLAKFCVNWMLFIILSINSFFMHNFEIKKLEIKILINDIVTNLLIILKFCKHRGYKKKIYYNNGFVKIHIKKK